MSFLVWSHSLETYDCAIVGSGAGGAMATLRAVLNNLRTVTFMGNPRTKKKARATWVGEIENMPVLFNKPKAIIQTSSEVFGWIRKHELWAENWTEIKDAVSEIDGESGDFVLRTSKGDEFRAKFVVLSTGIMDVQPEIQGDIAAIYPWANVGQIEYCIRCDGHKVKGKETAVIGHTESAAWVTSLRLLKERYNCPEVSILTNGKALDLKPDSLIDRMIQCYGIRVFESPIVTLSGDPKKEGLQGARLESGEEVTFSIGFVSLGTIVYNELAKAVGAEIDERGYVVTDDHGETTTPGVFAAGDLRAGRKKQIYTAWDVAVDAVDRVDSYIRKEKRARILGECRGHSEEKEKYWALMG